MSATTGIIVKEDVPGYMGVMLHINQKTKFLDFIGGMNRYTIAKGMNFNMSQSYDLGDPADAAKSEDESVAAFSSTGLTNDPNVQYCENYREDIAVSNVKRATSGEMTGYVAVPAGEIVSDVLMDQREKRLKKLAQNIEYNMINGAGVAYSAAATASKMKGILSVTTNAIAAVGAALSKTNHIDALLQEIADAGNFDNMVLMAGGYQLAALNALYAFQPASYNKAGFNLQSIVTPFGDVSVLHVPGMPVDSISVFDAAYVMPAYVLIDGQVMKWTDYPVPGGMGGYFETIVSLDFGSEKLHGKITGLADGT